MPKDLSRYRGMYEKGRRIVSLDTPRPDWVGVPNADRASQFMPFAALKGYDALLEDVDTYVEPRRLPTPEERASMDEVLGRIGKGSAVRVLVYDPGAGHRHIEGDVEEIALAFGWMRVDGQQVSFTDIDLLEEL